jgi:hypothetical protein
MAILTGVPLGTIVSAEEIYIEGAPYIYFQDSRASLMNNPDAQGYYWGLSGTTTYPVYALGCVRDVKLSENVTMNDVRCDNIGVVSTVQKRNYLEFDITVLTVLPLSQLSRMLNLSVATSGSGYEAVGIGQINNALSYHVYAPKVYDESSGDLLIFNLHKAKFVDAWTIDFKYGDSWTITGIKLRSFADDTKPATQLYGTIIRKDLSALP